MESIFSHIIQKRFSKVTEDVATDALSFILGSSDQARQGFMKMLRGIEPGLPELRFETQQSEDNMRPDMWGMDGQEPRVFVENKFWAGLTDNQPVHYLNKLASFSQPSVLLFVVPTAREQAIWRELCRRLSDGGVEMTERDTSSSVPCCVSTTAGPTFALTSWRRLLSLLELEVVDDRNALSDIGQLRALCDAADSQAFAPLAAESITDQQVPILLLQLGSIVEEAHQLAITEDLIEQTRLLPQANYERIGRYMRLRADVGIWLGIHLDLWRRHGNPLWVVFYNGDFGRGVEVRALLEPWAIQHSKLYVHENEQFCVALDLVAGEDKDRVLRAVVDELRQMNQALHALPPAASSEELADE